MNRTAKRLALAAVMTALAVGAGASVCTPVAAAAPPAGVQISLRPVHPDPASPGYFTLKVGAAAVARDALVMSNQSAEAITVIVSPVDGRTGSTSGSVYGNRQDPLREAGEWVTPAVKSVVLSPRSSRTVPFTVKVPAGSAPGDHLAGIAVENARPTTSTKNVHIKQVLRTVIGVRVVVAGPAVFHPRLTDLGIRQIGTTGIGAVVVGLGNDGRQLAKPSLAVTLTGPKDYRRELTRTLDTVLPGDMISYPLAWPDRLAKGRYEVTATLTGGGVTVRLHQSVDLATQLASGSHPVSAPSAHHGRTWWPWSLAALALAAAVGLAFALVRRRRSADDMAGDDDSNAYVPAHAYRGGPAAEADPPRVGSEP
jgi:WxL interacting protein linking bacterial and host surfaces